jgi:hypothetical protein
MNLRAVVLSVSLICMSAVAAEEVVISGLVLDTASTANNDKPLGSVLVEILDANGSRIKETMTQDNGRFHIKFDDKDKLTGKETIRVDASGYSARPTSQQIRLERPKGMKLAYQGEFLLTNNKAMRENAAYREAVTKSVVNAQTEVSQAERTRKVFASISTLPQESKDIAFGSVRALSSSAFSELLKIDREVTRARELGTQLQKNGSLIVPLYEPMGKIRFTGSVTSKSEMDAILQQAGQKGFKGNAVINDMQIRKQ